jgi:ERCC4-type nuclease
MPQHRHSVQIYIDSLETQLKAELRKLFPEGSDSIIDDTRLPVGDVQFVVDGKPALVIERKAAQDLYGSLMGTRFREQRAGMITARHENPNLGLCFVIEGDLARVHYQPNSRVTYANMNKLLNQLYPKYQIGVVRTANVDATLKWIGEIQNTYLEHGSPENILSLVTPADRVVVGNKRKVEPSFFLQTTLSLVTGMSPERAKLVADHYQTLPNLFACYAAMTTVKDREHMLKDFIVPGQKTHLGPELSSRVYYNLHGITAEKKKKKTPNPVRKRNAGEVQAKIANVGGKMKFTAKH